MTPIRRITASLGLCLFWSGGPASAQTTTLLPIISKVQVLYSLVGHYSHISDRVNFYNSQASPLGNINYVVPHLVYEPFVTLYNPHNTTLTMARSRVMISNPPVGFRFKKNSDYLRNEFAAGEFLGLARFQIANESNPNATKTLTLVLGGGTRTNYASALIVLQPGEAKTFSARLETNWTWGLETAGGYSPRSFYDWNSSADFTNKDARTTNLFGMEGIAGFDFRAGFQTDQLSTSSNRPAATKYSFETSNAGGWVAIKTTDTVSVEAKGVDTTVGSPDFQLALLRGVNTNAAADVAKKFDFTVANLSQVGWNGVPITSIARTYRVSDILQTPSDTTPGGKLPFAAFTIVAKSSALQQGKFLATPQPTADQLYETRIDEVLDFTDKWINIGPSDAPHGGVVMTQMQRSGDLFFIDVAAQSYLGSYSGLRVRGTSDLANGFPDDLTSVSTIRPGPENSGIYKVTIDVSGRGPRYFVRIEK